MIITDYYYFFKLVLCGLQSCVNVILDFISPENATECINLIDKLRLLPVHHKARKNMLEVTFC